MLICGKRKTEIGFVDLRRGKENNSGKEKISQRDILGAQCELKLKLRV